jgi:hypothetical protein
MDNRQLIRIIREFANDKSRPKHDVLDDLENIMDEIDSEIYVLKQEINKED